MPCSCKEARIYVPEGDEWGPKIWLLIHTLSLRSGKQENPLTQRDEITAWIQIIKKTGKILPCPDCKGHYTNWLGQYNDSLKQLNTLTYDAQINYIRKWFYDLHNDINLRLGKNTISYSDFESLYENTDIQDTLYEITIILKQYTQVSGYLASPVAFSEWKKHIIFLLSL